MGNGGGGDLEMVAKEEMVVVAKGKLLKRADCQGEARSARRQMSRAQERSTAIRAERAPHIQSSSSPWGWGLLATTHNANPRDGAQDQDIFSPKYKYRAPHIPYPKQNEHQFYCMSSLCLCAMCPPA
jgi:hypothetical protein